MTLFLAGVGVAKAREESLMSQSRLHDSGLESTPPLLNAAGTEPHRSYSWGNTTKKNEASVVKVRNILLKHLGVFTTDSSVSKQL